MYFELTPLALSSIFFFIEPKIAFSVYGSEKPSYQRTVRWTMQGLTEPFSEYRLLLSFYRGEKSRGVYSTERDLFLNNQTTLAKKTCSVRPSSMLKTVDLDYCSSLSVAQLVRFWFKVWPATRDSLYMVTHFFWLCVRTRCLSICVPSFVAVVWCNWRRKEK